MSQSPEHSHCSLLILRGVESNHDIDAAILRIVSQIPLAASLKITLPRSSLAEALQRTLPDEIDLQEPPTLVGFRELDVELAHLTGVIIVPPSRNDARKRAEFLSQLFYLSAHLPRCTVVVLDDEEDVRLASSLDVLFRWTDGDPEKSFMYSSFAECMANPDLFRIIALFVAHVAADQQLLQPEEASVNERDAPN